MGVRLQGAGLGTEAEGRPVIPTQEVWDDTQLLWDYQLMGHEPRPCSVAIGLGSHDLGAADATVDLYRRGMMPLIVFTGATSPTTRERMPRGEAVHYRERALELRVPASAVLVEPHARNTGENIRFSRSLLEENGVEVSSVLLVSKPYEERRAYATARKLIRGAAARRGGAGRGWGRSAPRLYPPPRFGSRVEQDQGATRTHCGQGASLPE